ncbi:N-acetylglucosamine-6-phosphate deacetylase [Sinobaca sp. H24]|uniref:N-acetylglucosamine-6-phosphate deacetylase n=1 Tax=Sinobaca sp. H24 TaxID=2923376 RepID=UPI0020796AAF|nr:N-acetylglucosamine-6-phosphate deacetylase [Sinobaca sp. H24]
MSRDWIIKNVRIVNPDQELSESFIHIKQDKIVKTAPMADWEIYKNEITVEKDKVLDFSKDKNTFLVPGFVDVHIHGANGSDVMDGTETALQTMASFLPSEGTTSFLATTMTQHPDKIRQALEQVGSYKAKEQAEAECLGAHVEGPFFTKEKAGAQPVEHLRQADVSLFKEWQKAASGKIKIVSLAPEQDPEFLLTSYLKETGVAASAAHSNAEADLVRTAQKQGISHATHLYNGMSGLNHREPGLAAEALLNSGMTIEMIVDGVHIHPDMVNLAYRLKGAAATLLITDSLRAKGLPDGKYDLGGQEVTVKGNKPYLEDGTIAGSVLPMNEAVKNMTAFSGCSLQEAVWMASWNPASLAGVIDRKGSIEAGKDADFVLMDKEGTVYKTWCRGNLAFQRGE